jgi:D-alanyl-D-alanine carboxypeptidase
MGPRDIANVMHSRARFVAPWAVACALALLLSVTAVTPAAAASRHAAMVIDANTGETLIAEQADEPRFPASLTKMMTLYMVFEMLESGRLTPTTKLKVSQEAAAAQPTKLDLEPGEQIAVLDAVKALITKSANDMAIVLAQAVGGSEAHFAELMTLKARALGMSRTTFRNASGLPDSGQVTTARDMLTLALRLQDDFPKYYPLFATRAFTYNGATMRNHNTLLGTFEGIDGIKTGYTRMSGFNLVTSLRRGDKHLVAAVFGGATAGTRNNTMRLILTRSLLKASTKKTRKAAPVLVARAKPAIRPASAVAAAAPPKVAPVTAAQPATPLAAPRQRIAAVAAPVVQAELEPQPVSVQPAAEPPAVFEVAKVRRVMVAPHVRPTATVPVAEPEQQTSAIAAASGALASPEPIARLLAANEPAETNITRQAAPRFATPALAAAPTPSIAPQAMASAPVAALEPVLPGIQRGAAPSTLQAQAQNLNRSGTVTPAPAQQVAFAQPARLRVPDTPAATPAAGAFHIQIGAFGSAAEAERVLRDTQARSHGLLGAATPMTAPVQKENRLLYRARFAGFDAKRAADTCLALRRAAIDCFVMKGE